MSTNGPTGVRPKNCYARAGTPYWWYKISINGHVESASTGCVDARGATEFVEARRTALRMMAVQATPSPVERAGFTAKRRPELMWSEALALFEEQVANGKDSERDMDRQAATLLSFIDDKPFHDLEHADFHRFRIERAKCLNRNGQPISPLTINREIALARQVFSHIADSGYRVPDQRPNFGKLFDNSAEMAAQRTRELTPDEEDRLLRACDELGNGLRDLVEFILICGQRKAASVFLTHSAIDWENRHFTIKLKGKGDKKRDHKVPLTSRMIEIIEAQPRVEGCDQVFTYVCRRSRSTPDGKAIRIVGQRYPFTIAGWKKDWARVLELAGVEDFRVHDLRHTNATRVVRATKDIEVASKILGHAQLATTARYVHSNLEDAREALEAADRERGEKKASLHERRRLGIRRVA